MTEKKADVKKIALVTGASRGIGCAIALELAKQASFVIGTATTQAGADKISALFAEHQLQGTGFVLNVCDQAAVKEGVKLIQQNYGAPTILVNNAGITRDNILLRMKDDQWNEVIDTNLNGAFYLTKLCLKAMFKARWGRIINISSVVGVTGNPGQTNYVAAKAAMIGFGKALAQEMAAFGITVNSVAPGFIATDMTSGLDEKQQEVILGTIPMKRMGKPEDISAMVGFLASDAANYITGQTLQVNGGMCMV